MFYPCHFLACNGEGVSWYSMRTIFIITTKQDWAKAQAAGKYESASLVTEGFIHLSRPHQVLQVAGRHFKGKSDLLLLQINQEKVVAPVKYEGNESNLFPHMYGPLNLDAVVGVDNFLERDSGFSLPESYTLVGDVLVRKGQPGDEAEITSVHTHAWQQSYKGIVPDQFLEERPLSFRDRLNWWSAVVEGKDPNTVFVAESAQHGIVGFCAVGPSRDEEFKGQGEIGAIYCLNEYKGKGVGAHSFVQAKRI